MPWRLILFILVFAIFLAFIALNLDPQYRCDINFGFKEINDIPVFLTIFISFALGLFCTLPITLSMIKKRKEIPPKHKPEKVKKPVKHNFDGSSDDID